MKDDDLLQLTIEKLRWLRLPGMARTLTDLLESAKQQNLSALEVASRAYVLESGAIALAGEAASLLEHPRVRAAYLGEIE